MYVWSRRFISSLEVVLNNMSAPHTISGYFAVSLYLKIQVIVFICYCIKHFLIIDYW